MMLLRLLMFLAEAGVVVTGLGLGTRWLVRKAFSERLERAQKVKQGRKRFQKQYDGNFLCIFCNKEVDIDEDVYKDSLGWFHAGCYKELVPKE